MSNPALKKRLVIVGFLLIVVFGGLFGFDVSRKILMGKYFAAYRPPPIPVTAEQVKAGEIPRSVEAIGSLEAVRQVTISPEVSGRITALHYKPGSEVKAGTPLVQLNDGPEQGDLQRLRAQAKLARINLERSRKLLNLAVSQSELDAQQATLDATDGEIARTEALIAQKAIRAPFGGQLGVQHVHLGDYVNPGSPLVTLTDLSTLYLNMTLPEQWHGRLHAGQKVLFSVDALPAQQFDANIVAVEPQVGVDTRTIKLQAQLDNTKHLLTPGMFARAALQLAPEENVVSVPAIAMDYSIHGDSVYLIHKQGDKATVNRALVHTDGRFGDRVIVRSGLKAGDTIVTSGQVKLHEGAEVQIVADKTLDGATQKVQGSLE
ncbi:MAG TPA: efflux RND transporter periplasmic adaptor subunit [Spongiibacteraceae bacterium]|nr:efflux RND transporter periplasmic adaptor subunit [Spongiibacteraceae bacterium]